MSICLLRSITSAHQILPSTVRAAARTTKLRMEHKRATPKNVESLQKVIHNKDSNSSEGWEKIWEQGVTPWDLGKPTPVVLHLLETGMLPKGRALVPGCGGGHDVVAIACSDRYVVGLDISDNAVKKATEMHSKSPNVNHFTFLKADFFEWKPTELFDLIFDYTFFCAIEPRMRSVWAKNIHDFLQPNGELITLMFPMDGIVGGPPYKVSISDYEEVLHPLGFKAISIVDNDLAVGPRMGREKLGRWKKFQSHSSTL